MCRITCSTTLNTKQTCNISAQKATMADQIWAGNITPESIQQWRNEIPPPHHGFEQPSFSNHLRPNHHGDEQKGIEEEHQHQIRFIWRTHPKRKPNYRHPALPPTHHRPPWPPAMGRREAGAGAEGRVWKKRHRGRIRHRGKLNTRSDEMPPSLTLEIKASPFDSRGSRSKAEIAGAAPHLLLSNRSRTTTSQAKAQVRMLGVSRRRSQRLHAASLLGSAAVKEEEADHQGPAAHHAFSSVKVKVEIGDEQKSKPISQYHHAFPSVKVKAEIGDEQKSKHISEGSKMEHIVQRPVRGRRRVKYDNGSRYARIMSIAHRKKASPNILVSGVEGRLFHNVFNHLVDAIVTSQTAGSKDKSIEVNIRSDGCNSPVPLVGREYVLQKILTLLLCMARRRLYDPPSDDEILYYREIKRHIRCAIAYHKAKGKSEDVQWEDPAGYHNLSCSQTISAVEELLELTGPLKELIPQFQDLSQRSGSVPDIAMHVRLDFKSLPEPDFSVRKTNAFYYNKLILALHDLKCSGLVGLSPNRNEKKSFDTLLNYVTCGHLHVKREYEMPASSSCESVKSTNKRGRDVLMDDDYRFDFYPIAPLVNTAEFFDGRLIKYMTQLRQCCLILMLRIMGKLEAVDYPNTLFRVDDNNIMLEWLKKVKFNKLKNPANAARDVPHAIQLARYAASLIQGISSSIDDACAELTDMLRRWQRYMEFAPQALLVLLLLECGAFRKEGEKFEMLLDDKAQDSNYSLSCQCDATFSDSHDGAEAHSAKILATILEILKKIGTSDALGAPSPGEVIILDQIMEHVSLCIDGFLCAKAYQKERDLRRTPYGKIASELYRIGENNKASTTIYCKYGYGVEGMSERLKQLQEGFNLVVQALQKIEII